MGKYEYLALLAGCVVLTLPLEFVFRARVWRRPRRALRALVPVVLVFGTWDAVAIALGHWWFNPRFVTGTELPPGLPVEEIAFFVVIPLCGLLTFEAIRNLLARSQTRR
ncbi:MAG: lycopene cyclase domain-containing protein [Thermoleophilaceae bacterium]|nr:lycopene cyclase domain-containing protein [Thermoleophilaceae bacterium]